jgi:hypothetical protein
LSLKRIIEEIEIERGNRLIADALNSRAVGEWTSLKKTLVPPRNLQKLLSGLITEIDEISIEI